MTRGGDPLREYPLRFGVTAGIHYAASPGQVPLYEQAKAVQWGRLDLIRFRHGEYSRADLAFVVALHRLVHAEALAYEDAKLADAEARDRRRKAQRGK